MGEIEDFILKAKDKLEVAKLLYQKEFYGDSVSSSYYTMLLVAKALLLKKGQVSKTHKGLFINLMSIILKKIILIEIFIKILLGQKLYVIK